MSAAIEKVKVVYEDNKPTPKIGAATLAGALSIILIYIVGLFGVDIPGGVGAAIATVFTAAAGYFMPEA